MTPIFIDTAYLVAIISSHDQLREKALALRNEIDTRKLVVTQNVLVETLNYFAEYKTFTKRAACDVIENLLLDADVMVVDQTSEIFHDGIAFYKSRIDKGYSLTDCISMNICRDLKITDILTHDDHFLQEGFTVLL